MCLKCCSKIATTCAISKHSVAKAQYISQPFIKPVDDVIKTGTIIWIRYSGGSNPSSVEPIEPKNWIINQYSFEAYCENSNKVKKYLYKSY